MEYVVYIQSVNGFPWDDWACSAYLGFKNRGSRIVLFKQIEEVPLQRWVILIASVENTREWLLKMDVVPEKLQPLNIPTELWKERFLGREVFRSTLGDLKEQIGDIEKEWKGVFVKPANINKAWPAFVAHSKKELDFWLHSKSDLEPLLCSEPVEFVSEWRCYIQEGKVIGIGHYLGNPLIFPYTSIIREMIELYKNCPAAYAIDIGILKADNIDGLARMVLVECNDAWSLGNYGLDPNTYVKFLMTRWRELMGIGRTVNS